MNKIAGISHKHFEMEALFYSCAAVVAGDKSCHIAAKLLL